MHRKLLIAGLLCCSMAALAQKPADKKPEKSFQTEIDYKVPGAPLPPLKVQTMKIQRAKDAKVNKDTVKENILITNKDLDDNRPLLLMLFSPTCSHCEEQTKKLEKNIEALGDAKLLLVAANTMRSYLPGFILTFNTDQYPSMTVGYDSLDLVNKLFLYNALPQINIYTKDKELVKTFTGDISIDSLTYYIRRRKQ